MTDVLTQALDRFDAEIVHVGQFDYGSAFRERRLRRAQFLDWAEDARFANVLAYWDSADSLFGGTSFYTETMEIDPASMRRNPSEPGAVTVIAELSGAARELMPRQVLRTQIERAAAMGFKVDAGFEFELLVLDEDATSARDKGFEGLAKFAPDNKCWSGATANTHAEFIAGMEAEILGHDVDLYALSVELGPGLLGQIFDGLQNPLPLLAEQHGFFLKRGAYLKPLNDKFTVYGLAGLNFTSWSVDHKIVGFDIGGGGTNLGVNVGGGSYLNINDKMKGFGELKYVIGNFDQLVLNVGVLFGVGK